MGERDQRFRWFHHVALAAALAAILLVATGATFWHTDAPGTADTCPICHVAHISALPGTPNGIAAVPLVLAWFVPAEVLIAHSTLAAVSPPPRAPPV